MSEALKALYEIEASLDYLRAPTANMPWEAAHLAKVFCLLPTLRAALAPAADQEIEDLWFTNASLPILAMSADSENPCVLKLFFRHPVTRQDRDNVIAAQNALLRERNAPSADAAGEVEAIRERHAYIEAICPNFSDRTHADRATLLRALDEAQARAERAEAEVARSDEARNLLADVIELLMPHLKGIKISADFGAKLKAIYDRANQLEERNDG